MSFLVEIWGEFACFTRPEFKVERVTYPCITPSAAKGVLASVYWHKGMDWVIDSITICNPIRYFDYTTNEVRTTGPAAVNLKQKLLRGEELCIDADATHTPRHNMVLKDVRYIVEAHIEMTVPENPTQNLKKFNAIAARRLDSGQLFRTPYLGTRDYIANVRAIQAAPAVHPDNMGEHDLSVMLHSMIYSSTRPDFVPAFAGFAKPAFYHAVMHDGVIKVPALNSKEVLL